ncbi:Gfo/Idh/MocA family oxidoreductase [Lyngbya aestuarii]|uniref:Gfo/Idh/MocA family oxidoreductase n=1 Tax=Lyngbya aestuarii TaxID=118322 RepID=UPI00403D99DA
MKPTRIAILGAGRWGTHLVRNLLAHPKALVVAVIDLNLERLIAIQELFDLDQGVILAPDWFSLPDHAAIEAVVVATPAVTHYSLIANALQQGCHVLAEKPLALDVAECIELCQLAQKQQRQLIVDHTYLFHPAVWRGKEVVASGCLGELCYGYAARTHLGPVRQDVNALWDLAIHDISIFNHWLGQTPLQVQATSAVWLKRDCSPKEFQSLNLDQSKAESQVNKLQSSPLPYLADLVQVKLTYPSGFEAFIHLCWLNPDKQRRLAVVGSQGTLIFDEMLQESPLSLQHGYLEPDGDSFTPVGQSREVIYVEPSQPLGLVCDHFLNSIRLSKPSVASSGWAGTQLVQILSCLEQSLQLGGCPVTVPQLSV